MIILRSVDGSAAARRAVRHALGLVRGRKGASIVLVNVQNLAALNLGEATTLRPPDWLEQAVRRASQSALKSAQSACRAAGAAFRTRTEMGPIAEAIVRLARRERADQIVMGTRGIGRIRGLLLGSIATQVVHLAPMPVTLVKWRGRRASPLPLRRDFAGAVFHMRDRFSQDAARRRRRGPLDCAIPPGDDPPCPSPSGTIRAAPPRAGCCR